MGFKEIFSRAWAALPRGDRDPPGAPGQTRPGSTQIGRTVNFQDQVQRIYDLMWVDPRRLQTISDIRTMDKADGRVKKIHSRSARAAAKGGIRLVATGQPRLERLWRDFARRTQLNNPQKLQSDLRGLMMEGELPMQWVLDANGRVCAGVRMPAETLRPNVDRSGVFVNPAEAYEQYDMMSGTVLAKFALWQLTVGRLDPENFDDWGSPGRPYLDATRSVWTKLTMTEEDLVLRRRMRAPQRMFHSLEGASKEELQEYRSEVERDQASGNIRDYYANKKGAVTPVAGDANLDQIADVAHLLDTFFSGAPAPKGLFGYSGDLSRDILEDLKRDWFDELAALQTVAASVYLQGFRLDLMLQDKNPDAYEFEVAFAERLTDTPNQRADLALKLQALGASRETTFETAGLNATDEDKAIKRERAEVDPYPPLDGAAPAAPAGTPKVSVTPGNGRKGESATSISTTTRGG